MRALPLGSLGLVLALTLQNASGQGREAFADPSPTPYPPVNPVFAREPALPDAVSIRTLTISLSAFEVAPERFALFVASATPGAVRALLTSPAATPARLASLMQAASAGTRATVLLAVADSPATARLLLESVTPAQRLEIVAALNDRLGKLSVEFGGATDDADVVVAMSQFAALDPRFRSVGEWSHYGRVIADLRREIATDGLTPSHKAALIAAYRDAAAALRAFLAAEAAK